MSCSESVCLCVPRTLQRAEAPVENYDEVLLEQMPEFPEAKTQNKNIINVTTTAENASRETYLQVEAAQGKESRIRQRNRHLEGRIPSRNVAPPWFQSFENRMTMRFDNFGLATSEESGS